MAQRAGLLLVLLGITMGAAGTWYATRPEPPPGKPGRPMIPAPVASPEADVAKRVQALREADAIADPLQRCLAMPLPTGWKWSPALIEAFCADHTTPRLASHIVRNRIRDKKGAEVDAHYEELTDNYFANRIPEGTYWFDYFNKFSYHDSGTTEVIDRWLSQRPHSAHAHVASAIHHASVAWGHRGTGFSNDIAPENRRKMRAEVEIASIAARRAIEIDARSLPAYAVLVRLSMIGGSDDEAEKAMAAGLQQRPDSYQLRMTLMDTLEPKWGGSLEELDATAQQAQAQVSSNPRLAALLTEAKAYRALAACPEDGETCSGAPAYFDAFEHGPSWTHFDWAVSTLVDHKLWMPAVELTSQSLRFLPGETYARRMRAYSLVMLKQDDWALAEFRLMLAADADDASLLRNYAWALRRMNKFKEAEAPMRRLMAADPQDRDARRDLAQLYLYRLRQLDDARPIIDAMLQMDPRDGAAHLLNVDWLQNRNASEAEIAEAARRFVEHADPADAEQGKALPKVQAWLKQRGSGG